MAGRPEKIDRTHEPKITHSGSMDIKAVYNTVFGTKPETQTLVPIPESYHGQKNLNKV